MDEISLQPQIGVVKSGHATGTCRTCTWREHRLVDQETVDELANLLEDSNSNVHCAEYATVWSVAAHLGSLYRPIPLWVVPTCNRFTSDDMAQQRRQLATTFPNCRGTTMWFLWEHRWALPPCNEQGEDRQSTFSANCCILCPWMLREA